MAARKWKSNGKKIENYSKALRYVRDDVQYARLRDIETVVPYLEARDKGCRELTLFVYRETMRQMGVPLQKRLRAVKLLNSKFNEPLSEQEALLATRNTTNTAYCFSNEFLIFILRLTLEDEKALGLRTIRSPQMKNILRWEKEGNGRTIPKMQESQENILAMWDMNASGMTMADMAKVIGVSRQSLYQLLKRWELHVDDLCLMSRESLTKLIGYDEATCVVEDTRTPEEIAAAFKIKIGKLKCEKFNPGCWGRNAGAKTVVEADADGSLCEILHPMLLFCHNDRVKFVYAKTWEEFYFYAS